MVNTVPARVPLGASTTARKWYVDCYDPAAPTVIVPVFGMVEFKPLPSDPTLQDDSDLDSGGYKSSTVTALAWGGSGKLARKTQASNQTAYDPGQEILRKAAKKIGTGNRVKVRVYEMEPNGPRVEAYEGFVAVSWSPDGGAMDALDQVSFTLTGQGAPVDIVHPEGQVAVPAIASVLPAGAAAGATIAIEGSGFTGITGATGVKIGATNAASYNVLSDNTILAVMPAGAAGQTTATVGTGAPVPYVRGA